MGRLSACRALAFRLGHHIGGAVAGTALTSAGAVNYAFQGGTLNAVAFRFVSPVSATLTDVYVHASAVVAGASTLTFELRNAASATVPGATLHASQTDVPAAASAGKWVRCTFGTPYACVAGAEYFIVVGQTTGHATNAHTILTAGPIFGRDVYPEFAGLTSANAFTAGSLQTDQQSTPCVLKFGDGTIVGFPYTTNSANYASNTRERGVRITQLDAALTFRGLILASATNVTGLKVYQGTTAPGGATLLTQAIPTTSFAGTILCPPLTLQPWTNYRIVLTFGGASTSPAFWANADTSIDDVNACMPLGGRMYETISDGGAPEAWVDNVGNLPRMVLLFDDQIRRPNPHMFARSA